MANDHLLFSVEASTHGLFWESWRRRRGSGCEENRADRIQIADLQRRGPEVRMSSDQLPGTVRGKQWGLQREAAECPGKGSPTIVQGQGRPLRDTVGWGAVTSGEFSDPTEASEVLG